MRMGTDPSQKIPGKTQTILLAETTSERWLSWVRLLCAGILIIVCVPAWIVAAPLGINSFYLQIVALGLLVSYSSFYLLYSKNKRRVGRHALYVLTFCDVVVITALIASTLSSCPRTTQMSGILYGGYFIAIAFTAFHHRVALSVFSGVLSIVGFTVASCMQIAVCGSASLSAGSYCTGIVLLGFATGFSSVVSRKNYQTVRKVLTSELRYDSLVDRLPEMIFTLDAQGRFIWSNKGCVQVLGVPQEKLAGTGIRSFLSKPEQLKLDQGGIKTTLEIHDHRGERKFVDCSIQRVVRGGPEEAFEGLMADVTDREMAISQREEMIDRLFQYQKMESIGSLASGMAHDFNNILQTIVDLSTIVSKESKEAETRKRMELILETTADARFLISELLALGRKKLLDYRHVDLKNFFTNLFSQFKNQLGADCKLRLEMPEAPMKVQGDPDYLKRVFQNIFGNARDSMPGGGIISVSCAFSLSSGGAETVIIRISDTGSGIAPELTEKIFDPFFTTKKPGKGTGLGLALVRRIITLHNGRVYVEQTGPRGTTFRIELPKVSGEESDVDTKSLLLNRESATLLILEDDPKIRNIMRFFLKEFDYSLLEASTSEEAAKLLREYHGKCRVLITDWKLAGEDPYKVIENLRSIKQELIVIVVSGYPSPGKSIERLRIYRWFTKPYDKNQLDIEIQRALRGLPSRV
ncbi:MAG: response regulator [Chitinispirillaceae bacterium]|nr:response regulator [Chitinispirillaceae bacterium]